MGTSVTKRISAIRQPYGGYLRIRDFEIINLKDEFILSENENIHPSLIGLSVDYLTRYMITKDVEESFRISFYGAQIINQLKTAHELSGRIDGLDDNSIICACKLVGYDVCYRSSISGFKPISEINPDETTINNIRKLVYRSLFFLRNYGPIIKYGFTFEGGYTDIISAGDGDFLTSDTLWDIKVSKYNPKSRSTLQILVYYLMGLQSIHNEFRNIRFLGIFNPRLNIIYRYNVDNISNEIILEVREKVIGYNSKTDKGDLNTKICNSALLRKEIEQIEDNHEEQNVNKYLTSYEAAMRIGISVNKLYTLLRTGVIDSIKEKNRYLIEEEDVEQYMNTQYKNKVMSVIFSVFATIIMIIVFSLMMK